jgi:hypothetical protein
MSQRNDESKRNSLAMTYLRPIRKNIPVNETEIYTDILPRTTSFNLDGAGGLRTVRLETATDADPLTGKPRVLKDKYLLTIFSAGTADETIITGDDIRKIQDSLKQFLPTTSAPTLAGVGDVERGFGVREAPAPKLR